MRLWNDDAMPRIVGVRGEDGLAGYAAFTREAPAGEPGLQLECTHLIATSRAALEALLGYFRRFQGVGQKLEFRGSPIDPVALVVPERTLKVEWTFPTMSRLLDLGAALEARGYPQVEGEATIEVEDGLFPENAGRWHLRASGGRVHVEREDPRAGPAVSIGALSAMFTGYLSPPDAVRLGLLQDAHAAAFLARLFAGPPPWTSDFF